MTSLSSVESQKVSVATQQSYTPKGLYQYADYQNYCLSLHPEAEETSSCLDAIAETLGDEIQSRFSPRSAFDEFAWMSSDGFKARLLEGSDAGSVDKVEGEDGDSSSQEPKDRSSCCKTAVVGLTVLSVGAVAAECWATGVLPPLGSLIGWEPFMAFPRNH